MISSWILDIGDLINGMLYRMKLQSQLTRFQTLRLVLDAWPPVFRSSPPHQIHHDPPRLLITQGKETGFSLVLSAQLMDETGLNRKVTQSPGKQISLPFDRLGCRRRKGTRLSLCWNLYGEWWFV